MDKIKNRIMASIYGQLFLTILVLVRCCQDFPNLKVCYFENKRSYGQDYVIYFINNEQVPTQREYYFMQSRLYIR